MTKEKKNQQDPDINHVRFIVWRRLRFNHGLNLNKAQLEEIDEVYMKYHLENKFNVRMYRAINGVIGCSMLFGYFILLLVGYRDFAEYYFVFLWIVFILYNFTHLIFDRINELREEKKVEPDEKPIPDGKK